MENSSSENEYYSDTETSKMDSCNLKNSKDALSIVFNEDIRPLIDLIDKLRRFGIQQDVALPNVVVVGDQSSGKSSIIEALSGVQLPRGKGIVTRCPLELQLKRVVGKQWKAQLSYCNKNGIIEEVNICDPDQVETFVRRAQDAICGSGKGVSNEMITLRIESPDEFAPDLTLIDLPGISRIALDGQPENICEIIRDMIMTQVTNNSTVILCVISANLDVAVNESVKIARTVDPLGERTIGVVTKPDSAEQSQKEDVLCLLNNEKIKLVKGFTMVKCRSQPELESNVTLKQSLKNETEFFESDFVYRQSNRSQLGTMNLARKISEELVNVIKKSLPQLRSQIEDCLERAHEALDRLAEPVPEDKIEKQKYLTRIIWSLNSVTKECLNEGKQFYSKENYFYIWRKYFSDFLKVMEAKTKEKMSRSFTTSNLKDIILRHRGRELDGFLDFDVFRLLIPEHIKSYESDAIELCRNMRKNVEECLIKSSAIKCGHLPEIEKDIKQVIHKEAKTSQDEAMERIKFIFKQEAIVFTMDGVFNKEMGTYKNKKYQEMSAIEYKRRNNPNNPDLPTPNEDLDAGTEEMRDMLKVYLDVANHRLSDNIPLTIMQCLLIDLHTKLESQFSGLCSDKTIVEKVNENKTLSEKRKSTKDKISRLQKATAQINRF